LPRVDACRRCLLPAAASEVTLDDQGVCNFCRHFEANRRHLMDHAAVRRLFEQRLEAIKGRHPYDALVGLSGGKDGAYVLYSLVREYGLKVLAYTYDNGFLAGDARDSVKTLTDTLGVDLVLHEPRRELLDTLYRATLTTFGTPCMGCALGGYFRMLRECHERQIPLFVHGRSPYQMYRTLDRRSTDRDVFLFLSSTNFEPYSPERIRQTYARAHAAISGILGRLLPDAEQRAAVFGEFFLDPAALSSGVAPESFGFFLTRPYDEPAIRAELERELGYRAPPSHADCEIHEAADYLFLASHGVNVSLMEAATMLRLESIDREQARREMAAVEDQNREPPASLDLLCDRLELDRDRLLSQLQQTVSPFADGES
jgi:hypothetical protein